MAPHMTASPAEGVTTADMPTPTAGELGKRKATTTSTSTGKHAMTTPYVFSSTCELSYTMIFRTSWLARYGYSNTFGHLSEQFLYIGTKDDTQWQTCQPTGATSGYKDNLAKVYRGAVCPEGWVAHDVGLASQRGPDSRARVQTWSSAKCCKRDDILGDNLWSINANEYGDGDNPTRICISILPYTFAYSTPPSTAVFASYTVSYVTDWSTVSEYTKEFLSTDENSSTSTYLVKESWNLGMHTTVVPFVAGRVFYPPMSMEWLEEDNSALNPKWPTLTSNMLLPTWPLASSESLMLEWGKYDNRGEGRRREIKTEATMPNKVAIPIISTLAVLLLAALGGIAFMLWKGNRGGRPIFKAKKSQLEIPLEDEVGSTADLSGRQRTGDDMELRERLSEGLSDEHVLRLS